MVQGVRTIWDNGKLIKWVLESAETGGDMIILYHQSGHLDSDKIQNVKYILGEFKSMYSYLKSRLELL